MDEPAAFSRLPPKDQAALLRALRDAGEEERLVSLVDERAGGRLVLDILADTHLARGRPADALRVVARREAQGVSSITLGLRSRALASLGRVEEALAAIDGAGEMDAYLRLVARGEALLAGGRAQEAREELERALALHPHRRRALLGLAQAYAIAGDWVTGAAFAARLEATEGEDEGPLSTKYLEALRAFHERTGGAHRLAEIDADLGARREAARARAASLMSGAPTEAPASPRRQEVKPSPSAGVLASSHPGVPKETATEKQDPPVTDEELAAAAALVQRHFGFTRLREGQAETLARVLRGEDVLAVLPTGGGKSICYQLPGVLGKGVTLVVSPLIALMKDQLDGLPPAMRAAAASITSELTPAQARGVVEDVARGRYRLLYVAPERLRQAPLLRALRQAGVARLVVDEAHCVSVWGHDFRPDYLAIAEARGALGSPPVLALTATAPPRVARDILHRLGPMARVWASVARPNLRLEAIVAKDADAKLGHLLALCRETPGPGLVYVSSRAKAEQLAAALSQAGIGALAYHAGLPDRAARQEAFMEGRVDVLVATVAFGMGVDKGDIRFVLHHDPSSSLENYSQEAGRAGRDGDPSRCVLLATSQDGGMLKTRAKQDLPSADLVDRAWALLRESADEEGYALVEHDALKALDPQDDIKPRVALSILAEARAAQRLADVPRTLVVDGLEQSVFALAAQMGVAPDAVEAALLDRQARGELRVDPARRALLYRVLGDTSQVERVMERYAALAESRAKEIMDYARTRHCRHAHLRRYFGEETPDVCDACDNCLGIEHTAQEAGVADDEEARRLVLDVLQSVKGIGETNLVWFLRGDARTADWIAGRAGFGHLAMRSESRLKAIVRDMGTRGLVSRETLSHGGTSLRITAAGLDALHAGAPLAPAPVRAKERSGEAPKVTPQGPLYDALKAWRKAKADEEGVPAYVVAHDAMLALVTEVRPATLDALRNLKGFGPKKIEKYGEEILAVVARQP